MDDPLLHNAFLGYPRTSDKPPQVHGLAKPWMPNFRSCGTHSMRDHTTTSGHNDGFGIRVLRNPLLPLSIAMCCQQPLVPPRRMRAPFGGR
jgi:hypothetical protein